MTDGITVMCWGAFAVMLLGPALWGMLESVWEPLRALVSDLRQPFSREQRIGRWMALGWLTAAAVGMPLLIWLL